MAVRWRKADEQALLEVLGRVPHYQPSTLFVGRLAHGTDPRWEGREDLVADRMTELTGVEHRHDGDVVRAVLSDVEEST